jgi:Flp pilus assembly protein TadG
VIARLRRIRDEADGGNAILEFIFVAIVMLVPLVYLIASVAAVQRTQLAVSDAARNAGRAFATSATTGEATVRARAAVRLALSDQGLPDDADVRFVPAGASCASPPVAPQLAPGAVFTVCVSRRVALPGIPSVLAGRGITSMGIFLLHIDDFRVAG